MASICVYDIDLLHGKTFAPCLELMKVYNYYYSRGDMIVMGKKGENFDRFNQVYFFKETLSTQIPQSLNLIGENKSIHGYGFYGKNTELREEILPLPPSFLCYDIMPETKKYKDYEKLKRNSIVRIENNDFSGFNPNALAIYVADNNFLYLSAAKNFLNEYSSKYRIEFLRGLNAYDEEIVEKYYYATQRGKRNIQIRFPFSYDFFKKWYMEQIFFPFEQTEYDKGAMKSFRRIILMILAAKGLDRGRLKLNQPSYSTKEKKDYPFLQLAPMVYKWNNSSEKCSFYDFIKSDFVTRKIFEETLSNIAPLRILLKQSPLTFNTEYIDFWS